jgi:hypothetical protein
MIVNNELEIIWKEAAVAQFELLFSHLPGKTEENHVRIVGVLAKIKIFHLSNTSQKGY